MKTPSPFSDAHRFAMLRQIFRPLVFVFLVSLSQAAWGQAQFFFHKYLPAPGFVNGQMQVTFGITGSFEITSATAEVEGLSAPLVYSTRGYVEDPGGAQGGPYYTPAWTNSLNTVLLSKGTHPLRVIATDALGNHGTNETTINVDQLPTLTIDPPFSGLVAPTNTLIRVTASDDGIVPHLVVSLAGQTITNDTGAVEINVPWTYSGQFFLAQIKVTDDVGQSVSMERMYMAGLFENTTAVWQPAGVYYGEITDIRDGQALCVLTNEDFQGLVLTHLDGSQEVRIPATQLVAAKIAGGGVLYTTSDQFVHFAHNGTNEVIGYSQPEGSLTVAGDWAGWAYGNGMFVRHLPDGITTAAGTSHFSLAANGLVVYGKGAPLAGIYQWKDGVTTPVIISTNSSVIRDFPVTDGERIIYKLSQTGNPAKVAIYEDGQETIVGDFGDGTFPYAVSDGWFLWVAVGPTGVGQVWRKGPGGAPERLTFFAGSSSITWVGTDGWFIYNGSQLLRPNLPTLDLSTTRGPYNPPFESYIQSGGHLYILSRGRAIGGSIATSMSTLARFDPHPTVHAFSDSTLGINALMHSTARIERSSDLHQWTPVADVTLTNEAGIFHVDTDQTGFFRAVVDP